MSEKKQTKLTLKQLTQQPDQPKPVSDSCLSCRYSLTRDDTTVCRLSPPTPNLAYLITIGAKLLKGIEPTAADDTLLESVPGVMVEVEPDGWCGSYQES